MVEMLHIHETIHPVFIVLLGNIVTSNDIGDSNGNGLTNIEYLPLWPGRAIVLGQVKCP